MEKIEEILLHLYDSVDYGFSYRAKKMFGISEYFNHWKAGEVENTIRDLNKQKLIQKKNYNGSVIISLTEKGMLRALNISFRSLPNKKEKWDGKWRMVAFDIPNSCRKGRDAIRYRMKLGGFYKLHESLFLYPFDCKREIDALVELFKLKKFVHFGLLDFIDNEDELKREFELV